MLLTPTALKPGQTFSASTGVKVNVTGAVAGGFGVHIASPADPRCPDILQQIANIDELLSEETELQILKQLRAQRARLKKQAQQLGCS